MHRDPLPDVFARASAMAAGQRAGARGYAVAAMVLAAMAVVAGAYWSTTASMVHIWTRSDTFAHGFVVPLIAIWLAWRLRIEPSVFSSRPTWWVLALVALVGFGWLVGELAEVNALRHFALVALMVLAVPAVAGIGVARRFAFPLCFLFFAVPFGEFLLPQLMEWTASFTVIALKATGIPVYREGLHFVIPSGTWSVVEACSGVRYLIASVMVGTLYAYLTYRTAIRRIAFVVVSFLVPVIANWLRAYMIVMLGHFSGNTLAVGVDHLIYGWLFFGVVMLLMFCIGARWREDVADESGVVAVGPGFAGASVTSLRRIGLAAVAFVGVALVPLIAEQAVYKRSDAAVPRLTGLGEIPGWRHASVPVTAWRPRYHQPTAELFESWMSGSRSAGVYVAFYRDQSESRKLVSSENVLVPSKDPQWQQSGAGSRAGALNDGPATVRTADLVDRSGVQLRVWHWYWVAGRWTDSPAWAKVLTAIARLSGQGDDSAAVVLVAPVAAAGAQAEADRTLQEFLQQAGRPIARVLEAAGTRR